MRRRTLPPFVSSEVETPDRAKPRCRMRGSPRLRSGGPLDFARGERLQSGMSLAETLRAKLGEVADPARAPGDAGVYEVGHALSRRVDGAAAAGLQGACSRASAGRTARPGRRRCWRSGAAPNSRGALCGDRADRARAAAPFQHLDALPMYEEMIVTGAWWDYVDAIATQRLWPILQHDPRGDAGRDARLEPRARICGSGAARSSARSRPRRRPTSICSTPASSRRSARRSSSCARRSAGRCANMPGPIRTRSGAMSRPMLGGDVSAFVPPSVAASLKTKFAS